MPIRFLRNLRVRGPLRAAVMAAAALILAGSGCATSSRAVRSSHAAGGAGRASRAATARLGSPASDVETLGLHAGVIYTCERVVDGDTIVVQDEKVRLLGVNAPETRDPRRGVEFFGHEASAYTKTELEGKKVRLEFTVRPRDKFGRVLAYVYLEDGTLFNARLVEEGYAFSFRRYGHPKLEAFNALEEKARAAKTRLWDGRARGRYARSMRPGAPPLPDGVEWVGNKGSKVLHRRGCESLPALANQVNFQTFDEAVAAGFRPHDCAEPGPGAAK